MYYLNFLLIFYIFFFLFEKKSYYLHYIFSLNYWDTNTLFLILIVTLFTPKLLYFLLFFFTNISLSITSLTLYFSKKKLVDSLLIGTIVIHPIMFYFFMLIFFLKCLHQKKLYWLNIINLTNFSLIKFMFITLILGGFWGFQSTIWGYFWVNDAVEWVLFMTIIYLLWKIHNFPLNSRLYNSFIVPFLLFNLIVLIRLNIFQTRHNFIEQKTLYLLVFFFYFSFFIFINKSFNKLNFSNNLFYVVLGSFSLYFYPLLFFKYYTLLFILLFVRWIQSLESFNKLLLHLFIFSFIFSWTIYFTFFFIHYRHITLTSIITPLYFFNYYSFGSDFFINSFLLKPLESVNFNNLVDCFRFFHIYFNNTVFINLNNVLLLYLLFIIFFYSKNGWI